MPRATILAVATGLALAGCGAAGGGTEARVTKLEQQVAGLTDQVRVDQGRITELTVKKADVVVGPTTGFELVVTWPERGGNDYRRPYSDGTTCERARQAVFAENDRREAENQAQVGHNGVVAVGSTSKATAVCLPL